MGDLTDSVLSARSGWKKAAAINPLAEIVRERDRDTVPDPHVPAEGLPCHRGETAPAASRAAAAAAPTGGDIVRRSCDVAPTIWPAWWVVACFA